MIQFRRRGVGSVQKRLLNGFPYPLLMSRGFAGSGKASKKKKEEDYTIVAKSESGEKGIVSPWGDNAPRPELLLSVPILRRPLFPGYMSAVMVRNDKIVDAIMKGREDGTGGYIGLFMRKGETEGEIPELITDLSEIHSVGTFAQIHNVVKTEQGAQLLMMGHRRITVRGVDSFGPPLITSVTHWNRQVISERQHTNAIKAYCNEVVAAARELIKINPLAHEHMQQWVQRIELNDPYKLADFAAAMTTAGGAELQAVLEAADPEERLKLALDLMFKEKELAKLQREISKQVEERMSKSQREYMLREQLKSIKQELGLEKDDKDELLEKFTSRMKLLTDEGRSINPEALRVIEEETKKLSTLEKNSPEFNVTRSYLDWLTSIPWGRKTVDSLDVSAARSVLDADHFGLDDIKKRILEFIAVGKLRGKISGKIICFVGPPGVGKTSIAKSIASALNREFYRFSVGGLTDIAEIKGHRRTYIGAMPGKPILCLKSTGCINPLILIDEIDKLGRGYQGDPASALLELLDPNQNSTFVDHYLDVPVDFSNVLFVCTANDESTIPGPLRDRMEMIRLSGYDVPEKVAIATRYLVPKALREGGFALPEPSKTSPTQDSSAQSQSPAAAQPAPVTNVVFTSEAVEALVRNYCRESGVRSLEKHIEKIVRKAAFLVVEQGEATNPSPTATITVAESNLADFVGKPRFQENTIYGYEGDRPFPPGIVMGLAWNPLGGSPVYIETVAMPLGTGSDGGVGGVGGLNIVTGQLGNVMKESVHIAYTFAKLFLSARDPENKFFRQHQIHLHVPEGAVEKDGPSAGVAMASSLIR